jgi:hypothetical protein
MFTEIEVEHERRGSIKVRSNGKENVLFDVSQVRGPDERRLVVAQARIGYPPHLRGAQQQISSPTRGYATVRSFGKNARR